MARKLNVPDPKKVVAWLLAAAGVLGTITGIIGFFFIELPGALGHKTPTSTLNEEYIVGTISALQHSRDEANLQLTQIAVDNAQAANQSTQQAINQQQQMVQATLTAVFEEQQAFLSTQNAIAAASATAAAEVANATATQDAANAVLTQQAADLTATSDALAQITPTPTDTPTPTPPPTDTPTPVPVTDYRALTDSIITVDNEGNLVFEVRTAEPIPNTPPNGLSYIWSLDTDQNPETGLKLRDIGVDVRLRLAYQDGGWVGTIRTVQADGTLGDPYFYFADNIKAAGPSLTATLSANDAGLPRVFDWVVRAELGGETYSYLPNEATQHFTFEP